MEINGTLNGHQIDVLSAVYLCSLTPSVVGSFSVLVVSLVKWRHLKEQGHLLVQLTLADLLAALILMFTSAMNKVTLDSSVIICQYGLPLSMTFYFISFMLVLIYAWKSKHVIQGWREGPEEDEGGQSQCQKKMAALPVYLIVWMIPLAVYFVYVLTPFIKPALVIPVTDTTETMVIYDNSRYCTSCILFLHLWRDSCSDTEIIHDIFIRIFLFLVVIPVMVSCTVIYHKVGKWYEKHEQGALFPVEGDGQSRRRLKQMFSTTRNMVIVILFCWAPVLLVILLSTLTGLTSVEQHSLFTIYIIQAVSVSLQGFLNSMVYAWRRPNFTEAILGENTPLMSYRRLAFFEESLRSSS